MARSRRERKSNKTEDAMADLCDKVSAFRAFEEEILPALRGAISEGKTAEDIFKLVQAHAAARAATIALTEKDPAKALTAIKDILDRTQGKAKERTEVEHKYSKLKDEELDSLILSESSSSDDSDETSTH